MKRIWDDCEGGVLTTELMLLSSLLVAGTVAGLRQYSAALNAEFNDLSAAVQEVNQSYSFGGVVSRDAFTSGSDFYDQPDFIPQTQDACISVFDR